MRVRAHVCLLADLTSPGILAGVDNSVKLLSAKLVMSACSLSTIAGGAIVLEVIGCYLHSLVPSVHLFHESYVII